MIFFLLYLFDVFQVLNLFVALLVNAFDFRETDANADDDTLSMERQSRCNIKQAFRTRKSRLFVAKYREPFRLYELQVLESSRCSDENTGGSLAICDAEHHGEESDDTACKSKEKKTLYRPLCSIHTIALLLVRKSGTTFLPINLTRLLYTCSQLRLERTLLGPRVSVLISESPS